MSSKLLEQKLRLLAIRWRSTAQFLRNEECIRQSRESKDARADVLEVSANEVERILEEESEP